MECLSRKPMTRHELSERLKNVGAPQASEIDAVLDALEGEGYVDDARLAGDFLLARAERLGYGRRRLLDELLRRGVDRATAERTWSRLEADGLLDDSASLELRVARAIGPSGRIDARAYRRLFGKFVRAGFGASEVGSALRPHLQSDGNEDWNEDDLC